MPVEKPSPAHTFFSEMKGIKSQWQREAEVLKQRLEREKLFWESVVSGKADLVATYLEEHPDAVDWRRPSPYQFGSWTALHFAAYEDHPTVAQVLLENKADVSARANPDNPYSTTPLIACAMNKFHKGNVVKTLLSFGADIDAKDGEKMTVLHRSAEKANIALTAELLNNGADPDITTTKNKTLQRYALYLFEQESNNDIYEKRKDYYGFVHAEIKRLDNFHFGLRKSIRPAAKLVLKKPET